MRDIKIIIVGIDKVKESQQIIKKVINENDDISVISHFTNEDENKSEMTEFYYHIDTNTLYMAHKNNSILTVFTTDGISDGIMIDDFYNNDIGYVSVEQFNMISDKIFEDNDILVVWIDKSDKINHQYAYNMIEIRYMQERIENLKYIYILNEDIDKISYLILKYMNSEETTRKKMLEEYS